MTRKWVCAFNEGDGKNKKLLGGKGANLCEMTQIGLRVPPGFVITTEACLAYLADPGRVLPEGVMEQVQHELAAVEKKSGRTFGGRKTPLLVSVRSGSAISMPGMMDTILNLGLNAETLQQFGINTGKDIHFPVTHAKIFGWYDNEFGCYVNCLGKLTKYLDKNMI